MDDLSMKSSKVWLTIADKLNIIEEYEETNMTLRDLAEKYNVGHSSICRWVKERERLNQTDNVNARRITKERFIQKLVSEPVPRKRKKSSGKRMMKTILNKNKNLTGEIEKLKAKIVKLKEEIVKQPKEAKQEKGNNWIYVQELSGGEKKKIRIKETDTVETLKQKIQEKLPSENERMIFAVQEMKDDSKTIGEYNVKNNSTVMII